jgi:hypothetical protein
MFDISDVNPASEFDAGAFQYESANIDAFLDDKVTFASVQDFSAFIKQHHFARVKQADTSMGNMLVNKATRDFWRVDSTDDGGVSITRLADDTESVTF